MKQHTKHTFKAILEETTPMSIQNLLMKTRLSNQIAKSVTGHSQATAYRIKQKALEQLTQQFPEHTSIRTDADLNLLIVNIYPYRTLDRIGERVGFHIPAHIFCAS